MTKPVRRRRRTWASFQLRCTSRLSQRSSCRWLCWCRLQQSRVSELSTTKEEEKRAMHAFPSVVELIASLASSLCIPLVRRAPASADFPAVNYFYGVAVEAKACPGGGADAIELQVGRCCKCHIDEAGSPRLRYTKTHAAICHLAGGGRIVASDTIGGCTGVGCDETPRRCGTQGRSK